MGTTRMERKEWFERSAARGVAETRREVNWESSDTMEKRAGR